MLKYYFFGLFIPLSLLGHAQVKMSFFDIIQDRTDEKIILYANVDELISNKYSDIKAKGKVQFKAADGKEYDFPVELELRGKYRRVKCDFPPLKMIFKKKDAKFHNLDEKYRSIRVVTHCYVDEQNTVEHLQREYLVYKMFQQLSPLGYRIKKVNIEYRDTINNYKHDYLALLIEDNDQLAYRLGAYECEGFYNLDETLFNQDNLLIIHAFQFMVANFDWSKDQLKNVKLFKGGDEFFLVPYDFDFSGMVASKLAIPNNNLGLFKMRDRCWTGPDLDSNQPLIDIFNPLKSTFKELIKSQSDLSRDSKKYMNALLDSFYDIIEDDPLKHSGLYPYL